MLYHYPHGHCTPFRYDSGILLVSGIHVTIGRSAWTHRGLTEQQNNVTGVSPDHT